MGAAILVIAAIGGAVVIVVTGGTATPAVVGGLSALGAAGIGLGTAAGVTASKHMDSYNEISNKIGELSMKADRANQAVLSLTNAKRNIGIFISDCRSSNIVSNKYSKAMEYNGRKLYRFTG